MLVDIVKGLSVIALYLVVIVGGIALAGFMDRRRRRRAQGERK